MFFYIRALLPIKVQNPCIGFCPLKMPHFCLIGIHCKALQKSKIAKYFVHKRLLITKAV